MNRPGGARPRGGRLSGWVAAHLQAALSSLGVLVRAASGSLMTAAVIGISLALPAGFFLLVDNAQQLSRGWEGRAQLSLFLSEKVDDDSARSLAERLGADPRIAEVEMLTRDQTLEEFRSLSGFGPALESLGMNPLPALLVVRPRSADPDQAGMLRDSLADLAEVELAQLDLEWVERLQALMTVARQSVGVLAAALGLAVMLIIGNTIRLAVQSRRPEIEIAKLFGATDAFIRRPFLYTGLWFGLAGGVLAWILVSAVFLLLAPGLRRLAALYHSGFEPSALGWSGLLTLTVLGGGLGLLGAAVAVGRHLRAIEPG